MRRLLLIAITVLIAIKSLWADVTSIVDIVISRGEWTEMHYPTEPQNTERGGYQVDLTFRNEFSINYSLAYGVRFSQEIISY